MIITGEGVAMFQLECRPSAKIGSIGLAARFKGAWDVQVSYFPCSSKDSALLIASPPCESFTLLRAPVPFTVAVACATMC